MLSLAFTSDVLDEDNLDLSLDELDQEVADDPLGLVLPYLGVALRDCLQTMNDEVIFVPGVLVVVGQLCVLSELFLKSLVQATVVLFQHHHTILEDPGALDVSDHDLLWAAG